MSDTGPLGLFFLFFVLFFWCFQFAQMIMCSKSMLPQKRMHEYFNIHMFTEISLSVDILVSGQ